MWWFFIACQAPQITIFPSAPTTQDELSVEVLNSKGEKLKKTSVQWFKNGELQVEANTVSPNWTARGQEWSAVVLLEYGEELTSEPVQIQNSNPAGELSFSPEQPIAEYEMRCLVDAMDDDDDPVITSITLASPYGDIYPAGVVSPEAVVTGTWKCTAVLEDGYGTTEISKKVSVRNLPALPELEEDYLLDSSFESEGWDDWSFEGCQIISEYGNRTPMHGEKMLFGDMDNCRAWQLIDLQALGFDSSHIDVLRLRARIGGYLANRGTADDYDDQIYLQLIFLDELDEELSRLQTLFGSEERWIYREAQRIIPVGTRRILATIEADWRADQQNDSFADGLSLVLEVADPLTPVLVKKPMLQGTNTDTQKIIWETDGVDFDPVVLWGDNLENRFTNIKSTWVDDSHLVHVAELEGFAAGQMVNYQVPLDDLEAATFKTAPEKGDEFSIAWLGDNQEAYTRFTTHVSHMADKNPDMLFVVGDLVQTGSIHSEWQQLWWDPLQEKDFGQYTQVLAARGNHDMDHPYSYAYVDLPDNGSHYSFLYGDVFILVLNTHADLFPPATDLYGQYDYMVEALQSDDAQNARFRIVAFHQAPFSNASQSQTPDQLYGMQGVRDFWVPVFEQEGVDVVIAGHYHSYQRGEKNGITYLVTGGGGSTLMQQTSTNYWDWLNYDLVYQYTMMVRENNRLRFETYDLDDNLIDSWTVQ